MKPKIRVIPITQVVLDERNSKDETKRRRELLDESLEKYRAGRSLKFACVHDRGTKTDGTDAEPTYMGFDHVSPGQKGRRSLR